MVFVLNKSKKPLDMISHAKARILLKNRLAVVHKVYPFTIRLRDNSCGSKDRAYTVKVDPGSKHTGIAIVDNKDSVVMFEAAFAVFIILFLTGIFAFCFVFAVAELTEQEQKSK